MVRSFPRTTHGPARARTVAVCATLVLAAVSAAVPHAAADDLKNKQRHVHSKVSTAQGDLDESSKALGAAARRLLHARAAMSVAQGRLVTAQSAVAAAARVDALMQARLQAAEHSLALARVALDLARARVSEQRSAIGRLAASDYVDVQISLDGATAAVNDGNSILILSDLAYAEVYFDDNPPPSVLQVPGAIDVTVESEHIPSWGARGLKATTRNLKRFGGCRGGRARMAATRRTSPAGCGREASVRWTPSCQPRR